ncbi:MAG: uracil-DNA glycosylase [Chloroflexota bacterium]|nr:uracil-DNA glycosylase [Chloroflexota bacterium]
MDPESPSNIPHSRDSLDLIAREVRTCQLCPLSRTRTHAVPGEGNPKADLMLIGEGPGYNEDKQGRPFVGAAGSFLNELLKSAGLKREDVYITNVVKCRPPQNRDPLPNEIQACNGYLQRQMKLIDPAVVATLGRHSMGVFIPGERIMRVHGQPREVNGRTVVPLLHPAAALHQPALKAAELEDFSRLPAIMKEATSVPTPEPEAAPPPAPATEVEEPERPQGKLEQLRMFE